MVTKDLTIVVKTLMRPRALDMLLTSIWARYSDVKIFVADDSPVPIKRTDVDNYFILPFDSGLSYGRNFLLEKVETKYVMVLDDDTVFTDDTELAWPLRVLEEHHDIDLVGGRYLPEKFYGKQVIERGVLIRDLEIYNGIVDGFPVYDFTANFFVARTEKIREIRWDESLKIQEHMDFFWRAKQRLICTHLPYFSSQNSHLESEGYARFRGRHKKFQALQCQKIGVKKIKSRNNRVDLSGLDLCDLARMPGGG